MVAGSEQKMACFVDHHIAEEPGKSLCIRRCFLCGKSADIVGEHIGTVARVSVRGYEGHSKHLPAEAESRPHRSGNQQHVKCTCRAGAPLQVGLPVAPGDCNASFLKDLVRRFRGQPQHGRRH